MAKAQGRNVAITPFRRLVCDLMYFSRQVPSVCLERRMNLTRIMAARQSCWPKPSWTAIFTKAFGLVAERFPELRQSYLAFPWPHFYEHPKSVVTLNVA